MDSEFLKKYYSLEREHWWFLVREKIIRQQLRQSLPQEKSLKILNVGVATGRTTEMLSDYGTVSSVEFDHDTCLFLRNSLKMEVTEASITSLPFDEGIFDVVCAFDVLEHIELDGLAVSELNRVCKKKGLLYITCPAFQLLWSAHDIVNQHYRRYTSTSLRKLIQTKFKIVYLTYFNFLLFLPIAFYRMIKKIFSSNAPLKADNFAKGLFAEPWVTNVFKSIFASEIFLLRYSRLPFGISILVRAEKE